jgi:polar amino acid transport system substrate-binding protein
VKARLPLGGRAWPRVLPLVLATAALVLGVTAADAAPARPSTIGAASTATAVSRTSTASCHPEASSIRPSGPLQALLTSSSFVATIRHQGFLIAGVDQNAAPFGSLDPYTGLHEGFDIDMIRAVAQAIFGNPNQVVYKSISDDDRIPDLRNGSVDIVAYTMTITCDRLKQVDFSTVYYIAHQRILVMKNSPAHSLTDLRGQKVCATKGTTSIAAIVAAKAIPDLVTYWTDCLVLLQQGDVAAISTDDTILAGLAKQDPWTEVIGPFINYQHYGLAIANTNPDFVAFVNAVLEQMFTDGQWAAIYARWVGTPVPAPPKPEYKS